MTVKIEQLPNGSMRFHSDMEFALESSQRLKSLTLVFETWGELNEDKSNAVLVHHALSVGSHVASHSKNPVPGWWQEIVGPGKAIDTDKYFVICVNNLGSCFGSSGPLSLNEETGDPYKSGFPQITIGDMTASQKLLLDELGISKLYAVAGGSMGAMLSLNWGIDYPDSLTKLILISSSYKAYPANVANRAIQHQAIQMDPNWREGNYEEGAELPGFKLARKLGLYTYRNAKEWNRRFNSHDDASVKDTDIIQYMEYNAEKFCSVFDANSYLILTRSMDLFNVVETHPSGSDCFSRITARTLVVTEESDVLFTPQQQEDLYAALVEGGVDCQFIVNRSQYGHDAFLVEKEPFTKYIGEFLADGT